MESYKIFKTREAEKRGKGNREKWNEQEQFQTW